MNGNDFLAALGKVPGVESDESGNYRFGKDTHGTFYFGDGGGVTVSKVREVSVQGDLVELIALRERGFFPIEELTGFKVSLPAEQDAGGPRTGFSAR